MSTAPIGSSLRGSLLMAASMRACQVFSFRTAQHEGRKEVDRLHHAYSVGLILADLEHTVLMSSQDRPGVERLGSGHQVIKAPVRAGKPYGALSAMTTVT